MFLLSKEHYGDWVACRPVAIRLLAENGHEWNATGSFGLFALPTTNSSEGRKAGCAFRD